MKQCTECKVKKKNEEFRQRKGESTSRNQCKECEKKLQRVRSKRHYKKHPEKHQESRDKRKESGETKAYNDQYCEEHREARLAAYDPDKAKENRRKYSLDNPEKMLLGGARARALKKGLPFNIVEADIRVPKICPVLKITLEKGEGTLQDSSPTLDRKIPELGYVRGNVEVISNKANRIKSNGNSLEIAAVLEYVKRIEQENT